MKIRLSVVVFVAFGLTSLVGALAIAAALPLSLERGFNDFLHAHDKTRFRELIVALEGKAKRMAPEERNLKRMLPSELGMKKRRRGPPPAEFAELCPSPGRRPPGEFEARLFGFDENGEKVFGPPLPPDKVFASPFTIRGDVVVEGQKLGSLMVMPRGPTFEGVNRSFLANQYRMGGLFLLILLFVNLIPAWFIARKAGVVVRGVKEATGDIVSGSFRKRAPDSPIIEVAEITSNINLLTEELQRLADLRRKWLAETSHELRTPLAAMTAEVDALADGVRPYSSDAIVSLQEEASNLGRLVNDLHYLAVADLSVPSYIFDLLDAVELCRNVVVRFEARAGNAGLVLELDVQTQDSVDVKWDKGRVEQLLSNILSNSLRYTDAPGKILITLRETSNAIVVVVDDTPPGVAPEYLDQLFEPLFRVDSTRDRATGGTGLGLSVAQTIVQMHRGTITVDASDLGGLCLTVTLPKRPDQS